LSLLLNCSARLKASLRNGLLLNDLSPRHNACITLLRRRDNRFIARWKSAKATDIALCSIVVYELRHGAERSSDPARELSKLDVFLRPFISLPFDDQGARRCAEVRAELERPAELLGLTICGPGARNLLRNHVKLV
jgi:predicted nucleic acid-binding protein